MSSQDVTQLPANTTPPTVRSRAGQASMAKYLATRSATAPPRQGRINRRLPGTPVPLSLAQQQVWLHSQLAQGSTAYNEPFTIHRRGSLDVTVLERALNEIVRRHEAWRTTFPLVDGTPVQMVHERAVVNLPVNDLRTFAAENREAEALRLATEDAQKLFDLSNGPLLRTRLVRLGDNDCRLHLTLHQIIFDGVSVYRVFLEELAALYTAFAEGKSSPLPELEIQYGDFAIWQQESLVTEVFREEVEYWRGVLGTEIPVVELPADRPRPASQTFRGALHTFLFPRPLVDELRRISQRSGGTLFMGLLASLHALIYRYTGEDDILVGTVTAGRKLPELERLVGLFINPLVLRGRLSVTTTFRELLAQTRENSAGALSNDGVPFELLVKEFHPRRDTSRNPFFQVMISLQPPLPSVPGWDLTVFDVNSGGSKLDMHFLVDDRREGILGRLIYNPDLFDATSVANLVEHWQHLLESAVHDPDQCVSRLPLPEAERQKLLVEWNATATPDREAATVHSLFAEQAARTPGQVALRFQNRAITYGELECSANQLARYLRESGLADQKLVGVCLERSPELVVSLLGILKAGCSYVPLDPHYPQERLAFMVEDASIGLIITDERLSQLLPSAQGRLLCLDNEGAEISNLSSLPVEDRSRATDAVYVIYTSGSTGRPKGVIGLHSGAVNRFAWMWKKYPFQTDEVCCHKTSVNFVDSVWEIFGPLLQGVPSVIIPDEVVTNPERLIEELAYHRVSRIVVVPSLLRVLLETYARDRTPVRRPRIWISSGEALTPDLVRLFRQVMPGCALLNLYGSSEVSADVTYHEVGANDGVASSIPIGRPIANTRVYLMDRQQQLVPLGAVGEITAGGDGVARGYLNRNELTAEKFISDSFAAESGCSLYRTGDLGRWRQDGSLLYLGRSDGLVKLRGFRIELSEIEVTLCRHPAVSLAVVQVHGKEESNRFLVAYVAANQPVTTVELRRFLRDRLPEFMLPSQLLLLPSLPLLPNGKVNRLALPLPEELAADPITMRVDPSDETESRLLEIWRSLLGRRSIGVQDNFFEVGGHSLLLTKLLLAIENVFGRKLTFTEVFEAPTVAALADLLRHRAEVSDLEGLMRIQPEGEKVPVFWVRGGPLFMPLAHRLEASRPTLGVYLPVAMTRALGPNYKFEDLARGLVDVVRQVRPHGPYYLGGLCVNGVLAYEMAQQLTAQGEDVPLVILFDSQNPTTYFDFSEHGRGGIFVSKLRFHLDLIAKMKAEDVKPYLKERVLELQRTYRQKKARLYYKRGWRIPEREVGNLDLLIHPAAYDYCPRPYSGRVIFIESSEWPSGTYWDFKAAWRPLVPGLACHKVRGGHESMFNELHVDSIAEQLLSYFQRVERSSASTSLGTPMPIEVLRSA